MGTKQEAVVMNNINVINSSANTGGGIVFASSMHNLQINNITIMNSSCKETGGGMSIGSDSKFITIRNGTIQNNRG
jgi:hypothetical protein